MSHVFKVGDWVVEGPMPPGYVADPKEQGIVFPARIESVGFGGEYVGLYGEKHPENNNWTVKRFKLFKREKIKYDLKTVVIGGRNK